MKTKKIRVIIMSTFIMIFALSSTCLAYSKEFGGHWYGGDTINGSHNGMYYYLDNKDTTIKGDVKITYPAPDKTERLYIEVRKKSFFGSSREHFYTSRTYKKSRHFSTKFKPSKNGKYYLVLTKAQRGIYGSISGTITQ